MVHMCALLSMVLAVAGALDHFYSEEHFNQHFEEFKAQFNRNYADSEEEATRFDIFVNNLRVINRLNQESGGVTTYRINKFADLSSEEMSAFTGFRPSTEDEDNEDSEDIDIDTIRDYGGTDGDEEHFDWRDEGVVTPVKNQGPCGSCWAFSAVGSVESRYAIKNKVKPPLVLSEQQLVDCDKNSNGCGGGDMGYAFESIDSYGGINTEQDYPYKAKDESCQELKTNLKVTTNSSGTIRLNDEKFFLKALKQGPFSIGLCANSLTFYHSGILMAKDCCQVLNHGLVVVGYGVENGTKYWIIKNSWGADWAQDGYLFLERDNNACGMGDDGVVPDVRAL